MTFLHFDEAKPAAEKAVREWLAREHQVTRALLIGDLFGKLRLAIWSPAAADTASVEDELREKCGVWWSGELLDIEQADDVTRDLYTRTSNQGRIDPGEPRLVVLDRHRSRTGWFTDEENPLWAAPVPNPPIVVFYSFKGGLGRSTILASFAIQRARAGERVCVLDLDLDSPGVGRLLAADANGLTAQWGIVDFLLEQAMVPPGEAGKVAREAFLSRAEQELTNRYYAEARAGDEDPDNSWDTRDMDSLDAPHVAVPADYDVKLASFGDIAEVAEALCASPYAVIAERIAGRFAREAEE